MVLKYTDFRVRLRSLEDRLQLEDPRIARTSPSMVRAHGSASDYIIVACSLHSSRGGRCTIIVHCALRHEHSSTEGWRCMQFQLPLLRQCCHCHSCRQACSNIRFILEELIMQQYKVHVRPLSSIWPKAERVKASRRSRVPSYGCTAVHSH